MKEGICRQLGRSGLGRQGMGCVFRGAGCSLQGRMWRRAGWQDRFQCGQEAGALGKTQGKGAVMQERAGTGHLCWAQGSELFRSLPGGER